MADNALPIMVATAIAGFVTYNVIKGGDQPPEDEPLPPELPPGEGRGAIIQVLKSPTIFSFSEV